MYYVQGRTMREIAEALGVSEANVSLMHKAIRKHLAERLRGRKDGGRGVARRHEDTKGKN
jgi:DNA-directed RNA polymerase specialized sigma24 family protein